LLVNNGSESQSTLEQQLPWLADRWRNRIQGGPIRGHEKKKKKQRGFASAHMEVPQFAAGFPMIMLSETPAMLSFLPNAEASNRWSVVFSNEASISTLSFIFATPNRVIPNTSPWPVRAINDRQAMPAI
jgi:hypothetical protein